MKQSTIIAAYKALSNLSEQTLPLKTAWNISKLMGKLRKFWDFQTSEESKFFQAHPVEPGENGTVIFKSVEDAKAFRERMAELAEMEQEVDITPFSMSLNDSAKLTAKEIAALEGFIDFKEE